MPAGSVDLYKCSCLICLRHLREIEIFCFHQERLCKIHEDLCLYTCFHELLFFFSGHLFDFLLFQIRYYQENTSAVVTGINLYPERFCFYHWRFTGRADPCFRFINWHEVFAFYKLF